MPVIYDNSVNEMNTLWLPTEDIDDEPVCVYIHIHKRMISERVFGNVCVCEQNGKLYFKTKHQTLQFDKDW